jgi:hypothetical protein
MLIVKIKLVITFIEFNVQRLWTREERLNEVLNEVLLYGYSDLGSRPATIDEFLAN